MFMQLKGQPHGPNYVLVEKTEEARSLPSCKDFFRDGCLVHKLVFLGLEICQNRDFNIKESHTEIGPGLCSYQFCKNFRR